MNRIFVRMLVLLYVSYTYVLFVIYDAELIIASAIFVVLSTLLGIKKSEKKDCG